MGTILKNHFALSVGTYKERLASGFYSDSWGELSIEQIPATVENFTPLVRQLGLKWSWDRQPRYTGKSLEEKLSRGELFILKDKGRTVGYSFATEADLGTVNKFFPGKRVMEIENMGMFPGEEGGGRGKKYFEMLFVRYFKNHDVVYWSQHETHSPSLGQFYEKKMGMTLLLKEPVPDFRLDKVA